MLYTLSAVQILALCDKLELVDADKVASCKWMVASAAVCVGVFGLACAWEAGCVCLCV